MRATLGRPGRQRQTWEPWLEESLRYTAYGVPMRVLLVEDDAVLGDVLRRVLVRDNHVVTWVRTGSAALTALGMSGPDAPGIDPVDIVLLDMGLPDRDGLAVCAAIRAHSSVPVVAVTGRGAVTARVQGLRSGADDYLVKPIDPDELLARIDAVVRRSQGTALAPTIDVAGVRIDLRTRTVLADGVPIPLTRKEFDLLTAIARRQGAVVPRADLLLEVWGVNDAAAARTMEAHMTSLRAKLAGQDVVTTVRGIGYRLAGEPVR